MFGIKLKSFNSKIFIQIIHMLKFQLTLNSFETINHFYLKRGGELKIRPIYKYFTRKYPEIYST